FFNGKVIPGDGSPVMEDVAFVVENGKIKAFGKKGEVIPPKGAGRTALSGMVVMPVLVNLHARPGLANGSDFGPQVFNHDSVNNDLKRYLYYGVAAVLATGVAKDDTTLKVRDEVAQGKTKGARLFTTGAGIVAK